MQKKKINSVSNSLLESLHNNCWCKSINSEINQENVIKFYDEDLMITELIDSCGDMKIEGTTAYLPPEIVLGNFPSFATDSWALGCLLFQCISGKPPVLEENDISTKQKIVSFSLLNANNNTKNQDIFQLANINISFSIEAKTLIKRCLNLNPKDRPNMITISEDSFFQDINVFTLYMKNAYPLEISENTSNVDTKWGRRQLSSVWSPYPQTYLCKSSNSIKSIEENILVPVREIIPEGEEANAYFFNSRKKDILPRIKEM